MCRYLFIYYLISLYVIRHSNTYPHHPSRSRFSPAEPGIGQFPDCLAWLGPHPLGRHLWDDCTGSLPLWAWGWAVMGRMDTTQLSVSVSSWRQCPLGGSWRHARNESCSACWNHLPVPCCLCRCNAAATSDVLRLAVSAPDCRQSGTFDDCAYLLSALECQYNVEVWGSSI